MIAAVVAIGVAANIMCAACLVSTLAVLIILIKVSGILMLRMKVLHPILKNVVQPGSVRRGLRSYGEKPTHTGKLYVV